MLPRPVTSVAAMILCLCVLAACKRAPEGPVAIKVNERAVTEGEFADIVRRAESSDPLFRRTRDGIHALAEETVTKELLLQEAMRRGLDRTDAFKWSIKNYYEQTLIKNLIEDFLAEADAKVTEEEIRDVYSLMRHVYRVDMYVVGGLPRYTAESGTGEAHIRKAHEDLLSGLRAGTCEECHSVASYADVALGLPGVPLRLVRAARDLKEGSPGKPVEIDGKYDIMVLRSAVEVFPPPLESVRDEIMALVAEDKQAEAIARRLKRLRAAAAVALDRNLIEKQTERQ